MLCPNCEKELEGIIEECPFCGCHFPEIESTKKGKNSSQDIISKVPTINHPTEVPTVGFQTKFCKHCGEEISSSAKFCKYCGKNT